MWRHAAGLSSLPLLPAPGELWCERAQELAGCPWGLAGRQLGDSWVWDDIIHNIVVNLLYIMILVMMLIVIICFTTPVTLEQPAQTPLASPVCAQFLLPGLTPPAISI